MEKLHKNANLTNFKSLIIHIR